MTLGIATFLVLGIMGVAIAFLVWSGRANAASPLGKWTGIHSLCGKALLWFAVIVVVAIEITIRTSGRSVARDLLFWIHLGLGLCFMADLVILTRRVPGKRSPYHARAAYGLVLLYAGIVATAIPIVLRV